VATYRPLRENPQGGLPKPHILIKHKLKDCDMMKNFMVSGSLTRGRELDEDLGGSDTMPFPEEDAVMIV
jgi:hypothetical protein